MAQCPVCLSEVPDDFGLIECHNCGAQLLVHMDGRVEHSSGEPAVVTDEPAPDFVSAPDDFAPTSEEPIRAMDDVMEDPMPEPSFLGSVDESEAPESEPEVAAAEPSAPQEEPNLDFLNEDPPPAYNSPTASDSADLSDIAKFGNSDQSGSREGVLRYNIRIHGIDTVDIRDAFREAITDRKFMWDADGILRSIRQGQVVIPNVTASKAFMLVTRLRSLPLEIEWEQYAVHQN